MIRFPNAKINLGLNVTERRANGYHNLETLFYPVYLEDVLEVVPAAGPGEDTTLHLSGIALEGDPEENIVLKAYCLLEKEYALPPVTIYLHKHIPSGAGLGGGSADGSFMIQLLNQLFDLRIPSGKCQELAAGLGADCPFFFVNKPSFATGIGTIFEPSTLDLSDYYLLLVKPPVFVSTTAAFARIRPEKPERSLKEIIGNYPPDQWRGRLKNDFETTVFPQFPELAGIKEQLYSAGALYASMSGSGSSIYGIFKTEPSEASAHFPTCFTWWGSLSVKKN